MTERQSNCAEIEPLLDAFADGELAGDEQKLVGDHLTGCADCQAKLEAVERLVGYLGTLPALKPSRDFAALLPDNLDEASSKSAEPVVAIKRSGQLARPALIVAAAAAALFLSIFAYAGFKQPTLPKVEVAEQVMPNHFEPPVQVQPNSSKQNAAVDLVESIASKQDGGGNPVVSDSGPSQQTSVPAEPLKPVEQKRKIERPVVAVESDAAEPLSFNPGRLPEATETESVAVATLDEVGRTNTSAAIGLATDEDGLYAIQL